MKLRAFSMRIPCALHCPPEFIKASFERLNIRRKKIDMTDANKPPTARSWSSRAALVLAAAAAACTLNAPAEAKEITVAVGAAFSTLDPYDCPDVMTRAVAKSIYEGLFTWDKDLNAIPQLAEGYEVSEDGLVYTIKLKTGVKFHDGSDFNADAVKKNFDRFLNPENRLSRLSSYALIEKVEAADPTTAIFTLKKPLSGFIGRLAATTPQMICPSYLDQYGSNKQLATRACGTGPYVFKSFSPTDGLVVEKNPNYRVPGIPKLDGITFVPVVENSTRAAMLRTGEAHFISPLPVEQIAQLKNDKSIEIQTMPSLMSRYLSINNRVKPFSDKRVREAINYAINKEALCKVAYSGYAVPQEGIIPPKLPTALKMGPWPYDPQKARELLKDAGYPNGFETTLWSGYSNTTAAKAVQFIQQQLAQVGIKVQTRLLEPGVRTNDVYSVKNPDDAKVRLYYIGWADSTMDPDLTIRPILDSREAPPKFMNAAYYSNPELDKLLDQAVEERDPTKRRELYNQAQKLVWEDAPWAFLLYEESTAGANVHLKNFLLRPDGGFDFYEASWEE